MNEIETLTNGNAELIRRNRKLYDENGELYNKIKIFGIC